MKVYLGVHFDPFKPSEPFNLSANLSQGTATLSELHWLYGSHASLAGWYVPQEFSDEIVFKKLQLCDKLVHYTRDLTSFAHTSFELPMMIAPYFGQSPDGGQSYAAWWDKTGLPSTGIDIFNLQDGVGTHRTDIAHAQLVFEAMAPVMADHGVAFWADNESFNQIRGLPEVKTTFSAIPTDINTFKDQIQSTTLTVDKSVTFEFTTYMSTQFTKESNALYQAYNQYFHNILATSGG